ncbi:hypothetical protein QQS21_006290 [Conoideocrella luteorostrata]|uniref:Uncharacterized protein n=1 Tax=Conoideocrella luteorostrata TaxID=1105319 RepID=A0AAJ0CQ85_9HYPO|nr:hypothetical protein QQS21_006290 [Conoideocrella luteorostrata]
MTPELEDSLITMAEAGDLDRMGTLLTASQESPSEKTVQNLLATAAHSCHPKVINFLLAQYPSVPLQEEVIRTAVNTGSIPVFEALLARDPSVINMPFDKRGSPLIVACMGQQSVEYLRFLLEAGANPNQDPDAAAFPLALVAALYKAPAAIDLLLQHGARLEHSGALAAAARLGNELMVRHLLGRGARPDADDPAPAMEVNASPLHVAVSKCRLSIVRILLQHGADPNAPDSSGATAIEVAEQMRLKRQDMSEMLDLLGGERGR